MSIFSFGGGVQSTAALVLAAQGDLKVDAFVFANVGADSENPATLAYIEQYARPYAEAHHIPLIEVERKRRDGSPETILQRLTRPQSRSIPIPVRMANGAPGNRACTMDFKIRVIDKWQRAHDDGTEVMLGISVDEYQRAHTGKLYPLLDRRMSRQDCRNVIADAGLPIPPKSSCWFCPFHTMNVWREMRDKEPEQFEKAVALEGLINERRARLGKDSVWLTRKAKPLDRAVGDAIQPSLFDESDSCESGYCMV